MIQTRALKKTSLSALFEKLTAAGRRILAPRKNGDQIAFEEIASARDMADDYIQTTLPPKSCVLPRCETILQYRFVGKDVEIQDTPPKAVPTVQPPGPRPQRE